MTKRKVFFLTLSISLMLSLLAAGLFGQAVQKENLYRFLSIFTEVFSLARNNYVEEVAPGQLVDGAFSGVTDAIDEFSYYVSPAQMKQYGAYRDEEDPLKGVGVVVSKRFGYAHVIATIEGSPAEEAEIEPGDFIERIDSNPTQKLSIWEVRKALQGEEGSRVRLALLRSGLSKREEVTLTRRAFARAALKIEAKGDVAYVKISRFSAGAARQVRELLTQLDRERRQKLIIDVRGNAAGSVEEAIAAADELLSRGVITSLVGRRVDAKQWQADGLRAYGGDLLVLTDGSTAGPGEIFAAAVRGNQRGRLVGVPTYGKAIHQRFVPLPSGGGLYLTIAHYTTPELKPITEQGVRPDVSVDYAALAISAADEDQGPKQDLILEKALSLFAERPAAKAAA